MSTGYDSNTVNVSKSAPPRPRNGSRTTPHDGPPTETACSPCNRASSDARVSSGNADPDGDGVDEQPDHLFGAVEIGRPSGHGRTEDNVVTVEPARQQDAPRRLHHGIRRHRQLTRECGQVDRGGHAHLAQRYGRSVARSGEQGRLRNPSKAVRQFDYSCRVVAFGEPGQEIAIRPRRRQRCRIPFGGVEHQQVAKQQWHGPAVEHDVVHRHDQPVSLRPDRGEYEPQQRWTREVEPLRELRGSQVLETVVVDRDPPPLCVGIGEHHLHRDPGVRRDERRAQRRMSLQQGLSSPVKSSGVDGALEIQHGLGGVDVGGVFGEVGMECEALLQRRQRPDVDDRGEPALPAVQFGLGGGDQWNIRRGEPGTGRGDNGGECVHPVFGEVGDLRLGEDLGGVDHDAERRGPSGVSRMPPLMSTVAGSGIAGSGSAVRLPRSGAGVQPSSASSADLDSTAVVVEADLRCANVGEFVL